MNPPEFGGSMNSILAHDWMSELERVFQAIQHTEYDKVKFTTHMLRGPTAR